MATTYIDFDQQSLIGRKIARALGLIREGRDVLRDAHAMAEQMKQTGSDGQQASHWEQLANEGGYEGADQAAKNAAAKASFDELASLYYKLNVSGGENTVTDVGPAITQACAKHGV